MRDAIGPGFGPDDGFKPLAELDGYLPIEDHGLIGNGSTAALVARDGSISWLCVPRFDSEPLFAAILDSTRGGRFRISAGRAIGARHRYLGDTAILITELKYDAGTLRITDLMPFRGGADLSAEGNPETGELLRCVEVIDGQLDVAFEITTRHDVEARRHPKGVQLYLARGRQNEFVLECSRQLDGVRGRWNLRQGESVTFCLRWNGGNGASSVDAPFAAITNTIEGWLDWLRAFRYHGPQRRLVRRAAVTLKLLDYLPNGALIAAPTTSLPEAIGGPRNWDYRYVWVRDAAFAVNALRRIGLDREAWQFLEWVLRNFRERKVNVMYTLDGDPVIPERLDPDLGGYRGSAPVRWGNAAAEQVQHDVYGEIVDCAFQWANRGGIIGSRLWEQLRGLVDEAERLWNTADAGIWEVRRPGFVQTYSAGLCHVALDRGAQLARTYGFPADVARWERGAREIRRTILTHGWDERQGFLTQGLQDGHLDASVLALPLRRVIPATHPRMVQTAAAIDRDLAAGNGLIYRYLPELSPDGLPGSEGAFVICGFWMVDNLTLQGRIGEALERFDRLCAHANGLGLLPEEIDPGTGRFLGNFPQAFSHIGLISSGVNLEHALDRQNGTGRERHAVRFGRGE